MNTTHTERKFNSIEEIEDTCNLYIKDNDLIDDENYDTIVEQVLKIYNGEFSEDYSDIDIENVDVLRWLSGYYGSVKKIMKNVTKYVTNYLRLIIYLDMYS